MDTDNKFIVCSEYSIDEWIEKFKFNIPKSIGSPQNLIDIISEINQLFELAYKNCLKVQIICNTMNIDYEQKYNEIYNSVSKELTEDFKKRGRKIAVTDRMINRQVANQINGFSGDISRLKYEQEFWREIISKLKIQIDLIKQLGISYGYQRKIFENISLK